MQISSHNKWPVRHNIQRILEGGPVAIENDGIVKLEDGPIVIRDGLWHGTQDGRFLAPPDAFLSYSLDARCGKAPRARSHDAAIDGGAWIAI